MIREIRQGTAEVFRQVTPQGPLYGPPLPEGLGIKWPEGFMRDKLYTDPVSKINSAYSRCKDKIFYIVRGI